MNNYPNTRTEQLWNEKVRQKVIQRLFTPRLGKELREFKEPKNLPIRIEQGYYFYSDTGYGKTVYAAFLLLQELKYMYLNNICETCIMIEVPELFEKLKNSYNKSGESTEELVQQYKTSRVLVLDDFGVMKGSDWVLETLYSIINYRVEHLLPTVYTSNHSLNKVAEILGDNRITRRIKASCKVVQKKHYNTIKND